MEKVDVKVDKKVAESNMDPKYETPPPVSFRFKAYVLISMTLLWTSYTLLLKHTRSNTPVSELYFATTVVFFAETTKCLLSLFMLFHTVQFVSSEYKALLKKEFFCKPKELLKMSVPSLVYAVQNNLDFVALANLDAGVYQVTTQLKVVTTAVFMVLMLGKHYSIKRWIAIVLVFSGVALVQLDAYNVEKKSDTVSSVTSTPSASHKPNYFIGIVAVLTTCVTAGFAGVYFEKMLKDGSSTPFWIRNLQMYSCGMVSAGFACSAELSTIIQKGVFHGYNEKVIAIIGVLSLGGVYISLVMKHLDNLMKSFGSAMSIILVAIMSWYLFSTPVGMYFVIGSFVVCGAIVLYNSVPN